MPCPLHTFSENVKDIPAIDILLFISFSTFPSCLLHYLSIIVFNHFYLSSNTSFDHGPSFLVTAIIFIFLMLICQCHWKYQFSFKKWNCIKVNVVRVCISKINQILVVNIPCTKRVWQMQWAWSYSILCYSNMSWDLCLPILICLQEWRITKEFSYMSLYRPLCIERGPWYGSVHQESKSTMEHMAGHL